MSAVLIDGERIWSPEFARGRGYYTVDGCHLRGFAPPRDGVEDFVLRGRPYYHVSRCEEIVTRSRAKKTGRSVPEGLEPEGYVKTPFGEYPAFRVSDCERRAARSTR
ncbi:hypothetical protein Pan44_37380 [Caulifigura coniformis]|uniref:Uncharacterized protein n=1 Tax=Caulifigura coniformis TaxID=2527983 RepID=A0A517SHT9_9PLAN|nr:hypothetical protein Pan44_37380 [Caulifigura coniformis]